MVCNYEYEYAKYHTVDRRTRRPVLVLISVLTGQSFARICKYRPPAPVFCFDNMADSQGDCYGDHGELTVALAKPPSDTTNHVAFSRTIVNHQHRSGVRIEANYTFHFPHPGDHDLAYVEPMGDIPSEEISGVLFNHKTPSERGECLHRMSSAIATSQARKKRRDASAKEERDTKRKNEEEACLLAKAARISSRKVGAWVIPVFWFYSFEQSGRGHVGVPPSLTV
jgi:hypothetical protein